MNLNQLLQNKWVVVSILAAIVILFGISSYSSSKTNMRDMMSDGSVAPASSHSMLQPSMEAVHAPTHAASSDNNHNYVAQQIATPDQLLPHDVNSEWGNLNMAAQSNHGLTDALVPPSHFIGLDTKSSTLRNSNQQLRSDPYIPKQDVGPWWQSTIDPDIMRVPLEIGAGPQ